MQTPDERRRLIAEGRYAELEHPADAYAGATPATLAEQAAFRRRVAAVFGPVAEREPGEEG